MKKKINLIILPLYRCNQNCPYCLFGQYKNLSNTLSLSELDNKLNELNFKFTIEEISIEGGEISLLSDIYFDMLYNLIRTYDKKIKVTTNFLQYNKSLINGADIIEVKYNFNNYTDNAIKIKNNIKAAVSVGKIIQIKSLDISCEKNQNNIIDELNDLKIKTWEIIPYQKTKYTNVEYKDFEYFESVVKKYLQKTNQMNFSFTNKLEIEGIIKHDNYNTKSVYITPNGKYAIGIYENNTFQIKELESIDELKLELDKQENIQNKKCKECKYKTRCLAKRYCNLENINKNNCPGFKNLIKEGE